MLRSRNSPPSAAETTSLHSFPGISVPGRLNQGLEVGTHPKHQKSRKP